MSLSTGSRLCSTPPVSTSLLAPGHPPWLPTSHGSLPWMHSYGVHSVPSCQSVSETPPGTPTPTPGHGRRRRYSTVDAAVSPLSGVSSAHGYYGSGDVGPTGLTYAATPMSGGISASGHGYSGQSHRGGGVLRDGYTVTEMGRIGRVSCGIGTSCEGPVPEVVNFDTIIVMMRDVVRISVFFGLSAFSLLLVSCGCDRESMKTRYAGLTRRLQELLQAAHSEVLPPSLRLTDDPRDAQFLMSVQRYISFHLGDSNVQ